MVLFSVCLVFVYHTVLFLWPFCLSHFCIYLTCLVSLSVLFMCIWFVSVSDLRCVWIVLFTEKGRSPFTPLSWFSVSDCLLPCVYATLTVFFQCLSVFFVYLSEWLASVSVHPTLSLCVCLVSMPAFSALCLCLCMLVFPVSVWQSCFCVYLSSICIVFVYFIVLCLSVSLSLATVALKLWTWEM